jgi:hypothetical protein
MEIGRQGCGVPLAQNPFTALGGTSIASVTVAVFEKYDRSLALRASLSLLRQLASYLLATLSLGIGRSYMGSNQQWLKADHSLQVGRCVVARVLLAS